MIYIYMYIYIYISYIYIYIIYIYDIYIYIYDIYIYICTYDIYYTIIRHHRNNMSMYTHLGQTTIFQSSWWWQTKWGIQEPGIRKYVCLEQSEVTFGISLLFIPASVIILQWYYHTFAIFPLCFCGAFAIFDSQWLSPKKHHFRAGFQDLWVPRSVGGNMPYTIPFLRSVAYRNPKSNMKAISPDSKGHSWKIRIIWSLDHLQKPGGIWRVLDTDECKCPLKELLGSQTSPAKKRGSWHVMNLRMFYHLNLIFLCWAHGGWGRGAQNNRICL